MRFPMPRGVSVIARDFAGNWSEREDSNLRPPAPEAGALPDCATLRPWGGVKRFCRESQGGSGEFAAIRAAPQQRAKARQSEDGASRFACSLCRVIIGRCGRIASGSADSPRRCRQEGNGRQNPGNRDEDIAGGALRARRAYAVDDRGDGPDKRDDGSPCHMERGRASAVRATARPLAQRKSWLR